MKTLLITLEFPPFKGGVANYYGNLVNYWPWGESISVLDNSRLELMRPGKFLAWWPALGNVYRKIKLMQADYLLVGNVLPLGTVALFLSFFRPIRYAVFLHGLDLSLSLKSERKKILTALILRRADKIICANSYTAQMLKEAYKFLNDHDYKIQVLNPGVTKGAPFVRSEAIANLREDYQLSGKTVLFTLGRLVKRKGADQVIRALAALPIEESQKFFYCLAGIGPDAKYLYTLVPPHLTQNIVFLGEINEEEKWRWLNLCDIFIMPARNINGDYEGFGIVYLEANLCGKPVIAGLSGGASDAVIDGVNGIMVDPEDVGAISQAILDLSGNEEKRRRLGESGRDRALKEFNWEQQAFRLLNIIKV